MEKMLVTGGNGLLGTKLLARAMGCFDVISFSLRPAVNVSLGEFDFYQGDVTDKERVTEVFFKTRPRVVVHTAAMTDVDGCERDKDTAWRINVEGTQNVALACSEVGARLIHISSDYVFDGESGPYSEEDPPNPVSVYGNTKLEGEKLAKELCRDCCVARTSVLYGFSPWARDNFVTWVARSLKMGRKISVVTDEYCSPTLADNLADMVLALAQMGDQGVYNTVGGEIISRFDFAIKIARKFRLDPTLVDPAITKDLGRPARRPTKGGLIPHRVQRELGIRPMSVEEGLATMEEQWQRWSAEKHPTLPSETGLMGNDSRNHSDP